MKKEARRKKYSEVAMWVDRYGDLFSDFDPRPYAQKSLSFDFLVELKRAARDQYGCINLNILMPKRKRKPSAEKDIKKRLSDYFSKHYTHTKEKSKGIFQKGLWFCLAGIILMFVASFLLFYYPEEIFFFNFLIVLMEPGGWFLFWEGLNLAIFESKVEKPNVEFYKKMSHAKIQFSSY